MNALIGNVPLTQKEFLRLSSFIHTEFGIKMPPAKKILIESRLQKRLKRLGIGTFKEYCDYLFSSEGQRDEVPHFISQITTNKTDFFRESEHFNFLVTKALPILLENGGSNRNLTAWSAGCSTGEEPYTLAIVLNEFVQTKPDLGLKFSVLATDVSPEVLQVAKTAVYKEVSTEPIPITLKQKYFLKNKDRNNPIVKVAPELRRTVRFERLNFMDRDYGLKQSMDIIFFRNVLIYFDKPTQEAILNKLCHCLKKGGYFFQGHSESTQGMNLPLKSVAPTIYQKI